ncbi:hypothetical protein RJ641_000187 [Dillenia turbinata]|uniref:Proton pump-interactor 1 n=1 Tax=Dillenia turbinata TaxID=194707 RepID=A0AAN8WBH3_9MAGN
MGVEVTGSDVVQIPMEAGSEKEDGKLDNGPVDVVAAEVIVEGKNEKENGMLDKGPAASEPIKFGSYATDEPKKEGNNVSDANFPKDAVDEWPAPKQIHLFYFIRAQVIAQLKALGVEHKQFRAIVDEKRKEMEPLQQALGKLRSTNSNRSEKGYAICSSEEELNELIQSLHYRIQHESIPLSEEKKLIKEIKQLEGTREKVIANAAMRVKIQESMGQKEAIQDQVKLIGVDLDGVRKDQQVVRGKIKQLEEELKGIDGQIEALQEELTAVTQKRDKAYETIQDLRKQRDEGNAHFYQNRSLLNSARDLAVKKDIKALEELSRAEVEKFMGLWSSNKAFRDDYEKRILPSLDARQLSRDGRMRNPDEKPLVVVEAPTPVEVEMVAKAAVKHPKEDPKPAPQPEAVPTKKVQKEANKKQPDPVPASEPSDFEVPVLETQKNPPKEEIDPEKLKEMKREEEIAKAKQALERRKKLAEKAAAKAAARAQKEAEKKLKEIICYSFFQLLEREKKARKKAGASAPGSNPEGEEPCEPVSEAAEPEKASETVEVPVPSKKKEQNENAAIRYRTRSKGPESLPKAIIRRRKSPNYWLYGAGGAAVLILVLLVLGFQYFRQSGWAAFGNKWRQIAV